MAKPSIVHLLRYFDEQAEAIDRLALIVSLNPTGGPVHKLRVATRRARAALWILKQSSKSTDFCKLNRKLKKLGKKLGTIRELEVASSDAANYELDASKLKPALKSARKAIRTYLKSRRCRELSHELSRVPKIIRGSETRLHVATRILSDRLSPWLTRKLTKDSCLHELRICFKKTRYSLEALGKPVESLREIQQILGRNHDLEILRAWLGNDKKTIHDQKILRHKASQAGLKSLRSALNELNSFDRR